MFVRAFAEKCVRRWLSLPVVHNLVMSGASWWFPVQILAGEVLDESFHTLAFAGACLIDAVHHFS